MTNSKIETDTAKKIPKGLTNAGKGRPKGALNKSTQTAKDAIALAAEGLGGTQRLIDWAKEDPSNERAFWSSIYPKLLPLQVNGAGENGEHIHKHDVIGDLLKACEGTFMKPNE